MSLTKLHAMIPKDRSELIFDDRSLLWRCLQGVARLLTTTLYDLHVYGLHHVPRTGGVLVVSNHQSYLDPIMVAVRLPRAMSFLAQSNLFKNPAFALLIRSLNAFPIQQGKGDVGAMKQTIKLLKDGALLNIFPEGHRSGDGRLQAVQPGVALVIKRAGVPVVPAMIDGTFRAWPRRQLLPRPGRVRLLYGPAMDLADLDGREIVRRIERRFQELQAELAQRVKRTH